MDLSALLNLLELSVQVALDTLLTQRLLLVQVALKTLPALLELVQVAVETLLTKEPVFFHGFGGGSFLHFFSNWHNLA